MIGQFISIPFKGLPSGIHISIGIFYKLYALLEGECHLLVLRLALQLPTNTGLTTASYEEYATALRELTALKEQLHGSVTT